MKPRIEPAFFQHLHTVVLYLIYGPLDNKAAWPITPHFEFNRESMWTNATSDALWACLFCQSNFKLTSALFLAVAIRWYILKLFKRM